MNIEVLAAGTKPPDWIATGIADYQKRLPRDWQFSFKDIPVSKRHKGEPVARAIQAEGEKMLAAMSSDSIVVSMDRGGQNWSTEQLAQNLDQWQQEASKIQILIGGPDGLAQECLAAANRSWSLSKLTFPHFLVRILLAEQVYRAWSVLNNHPYHK